MEASNCNVNSHITCATGISEYGTAMPEPTGISCSSNSEGAGLASTSNAPPLSSDVSHGTHMGQQSSEHATAVQAMEHITPLRLIDVDKSVLESGVVYAAPGDISPATYSALSHVWSKGLSDSNATHVGIEWGVTAFKEENMKEVLRIVRGCGVLFLWVDAYCIDQSDREEKGREIPRMGSYYSNAASVFILPNGVDNIYEDSIVFGRWKRHWCMWTQRVWTVPELSLAKKAMVICCLRTEQGQRVRIITTEDLDKQLFPIIIEHHFPLEDDKEIIVTDIEGFCDIVGLKSTGYLDGDRDDNNDNDYRESRFTEATQRTLLGKQDEKNQTINQWLHRIVTRDCKHDVDRVHSMLPVLNMNLAFVSMSDDLNGILAKVFEEADLHVLAQLMLATKTSGYGSTLSIYPMVQMIDPEEDEGDMLVHISEEIHLDNRIRKSFEMDALELKDVIVTKPVTVQRYIYEYREGIPSSDDIFGNTAYTLGDFHLPCSVGKCKIGVAIELVRLGTIDASSADLNRMLEMVALKGINTDALVLVCCLACSRHDGFLEKVGVLLVEEGTFNEIDRCEPDTIRLR